MKDHDAIDLLEELVRIPSVSRDEGAAARWLVQRMAALGFEAEVDEVGNAVGRIGDQGPRLVLLGHIDTVPGEVPVRREAGRLYGRGTVDAKGPLAAFVAGAARAAADGSLACRVEVVGCVEEEVPSSRGARFRARGPAPDACLVGEPSGWQGVTIGYKGFLRCRLERTAPLAHTAGRPDGLGALACRTYVELERAAAAFGEGRGALYEQLLVHLAGLELTEDGLAERATLDLRLRLPEDLGPERAERFVASVAEGWTVTVEGGLPAFSTTRTDPLARLLARAVSRAGGRPRFVRKTGTADLNVVGPAWRCPTAVYGPGDSALDHTPDEHLELEEYTRSVGVLADLLGDRALAGLARAPEHARA